MVWMGPLERLKMTSDANEEHTIDFHIVGNLNMTNTHDPRTSVTDVKLSAVQTNVTVILRSISDDTRQDRTINKLT
jgi:hypothetical protein